MLVVYLSLICIPSLPCIPLPLNAANTSLHTTCLVYLRPNLTGTSPI